MNSLRASGIGAMLLMLSSCNDIFGVTPYYRADCEPQEKDCAGNDANDATLGQPVASAGFGDANAQGGRVVATDFAGNVFVAGVFNGSINLGGVPLNAADMQDIFLAKFDPSLKHIWSKSFSGIGDDVVTSLAVDGGGNVVIGGKFPGSISFGGSTLITAGNDDMFVARFDQSGNHLWSKRFGDAAAQSLNGISVDAMGNIYFTGENQGNIDFGCGATGAAINSDVFVGVLVATGACLWAKNYASEGSQVGKGIAQDGSFGAFVIGDFQGSLKIGPQNRLSLGGIDVFILKVNGNGAPLWAFPFGSAANELGTGVAADSLGHVTLTGVFSDTIDLGTGMLKSAGSAGATDVFVATLGNYGLGIWSRQWGGEKFDVSNQVALDNEGNVLVVGYSGNTQIDFGLGPVSCVGNSDVIAVKYNKDGEILWGKCWGTNGWDIGWGIAADPMRNVFIAGEFGATINFGNELVSKGSSDIFLAKLTP
jgi:hypothetical protein